MTEAEPLTAEERALLYQAVGEATLAGLALDVTLSVLRAHNIVPTEVLEEIAHALQQITDTKTIAASEAITTPAGFAQRRIKLTAERLGVKLKPPKPPN